MVSIITALFNRKDLLPYTWDSIKNQTHAEWEWIVVDDGSSDGADSYIAHLAENDNRIKLYYRKDGLKGPSRCRNIGAKAANGTYLIFLDSDDLIAPTCLQNRVAHLRQFPDLDFAVFTQATFEKTPSEKHTIFNKFFTNKNDYLNAFIADQHPWQTSGPIWKKESLVSTGGFREDYAIMEDPELHIRTLLKNLRYKVVNSEPDFFYRIQPKTLEQYKVFWEISIKGRIVFYRDLLKLLRDEKAIDMTLPSMKKGIINFFRTFLLNRSIHYPSEFNEFVRWSYENKLINSYQKKLILLYHFIQKSPSFSGIPLLKGVIYKLI